MRCYQLSSSIPELLLDLLTYSVLLESNWNEAVWATFSSKACTDHSWNAARPDTQSDKDAAPALVRRKLEP